MFSARLPGYSIGCIIAEVWQGLCSKPPLASWRSSADHLLGSARKPGQRPAIETALTAVLRIHFQHQVGWGSLPTSPRYLVGTQALLATAPIPGRSRWAGAIMGPAPRLALPHRRALLDTEISGTHSQRSGISGIKSTSHSFLKPGVRPCTGTGSPVPRQARAGAWIP
jgi:hypothetical protein